MMIAIVPVLVAIVGALMYAFTGSKLSQIGFALFCIGAFFTVWALAGHSVTLIPK